MNIELGMRPPSSPCDIIPTRLSGEIMGAIRSNVLSIINSSLFWMCTRPFLRHSVFNCYSGSRGLESTDSKKKKFKKKSKGFASQPASCSRRRSGTFSCTLVEVFDVIWCQPSACEWMKKTGGWYECSVLGSSAAMLHWNIRVYIC